MSVNISLHDDMLFLFMFTEIHNCSLSFTDINLIITPYTLNNTFLQSKAHKITINGGKKNYNPIGIANGSTAAFQKHQVLAMNPSNVAFVAKTRLPTS